MTGWTALPDLASRALGGSVVAASDEFFADKENLVTPEPPVFTPEAFTAKGQVYDGWETRRRRGAPGHDWAVVRLGAPGVVRGVVVDTAFFLGNFPERCAVQGAAVEGYPAPAALASADWVELVPPGPLAGGTVHAFEVAVERRFTHVRLEIHPDGGVARLRVHGEPVPDPRQWAGLPLDLAATVNGGTVVACSDSFYSPPGNLLQPGLSRRMSDGWETSRRRGGGNDWAVVQLAGHAVPVVADLDTTHYRGNAPDHALLSGADAQVDADEWFPLLPPTPLQPDTPHRFRLAAARPVTHVRLDIVPDGGLARFRLYGQLTPDGLDAALRRYAHLSAVPVPADLDEIVLSDRRVGTTSSRSAQVAARVAARVAAQVAAQVAEMLATAVAEARAGLAGGGIPIGAALFGPDGALLGRGHNRRVQDGDPSMHAETAAFRNAGRQRSYRSSTMVTTLSPCWYCSGLVRQFGISRVVVGEARTFHGGHDWLAEHGVEIVLLDDPGCVALMTDFIAANPALWYEDIGES
jgi:allantoicase